MDRTAERQRIKNRIEEQQGYQRELMRLAALTPEQAAIDLDKKCPHCGAYLAPTEIDNPLRPGRKLRIWPEEHGCKPEARARHLQAQEDAKAAAERKAAEYEASLLKAGLIGWLGKATLDSFIPRPDWPEAKEVKRRAAAYVEAVMSMQAESVFLVLCGQFGNGKSHLAAAVIRQFIDAGWRNCYFRNWSEYLQRIQATFNRKDEDGETEEQIIAELQKGSIVAIDDLDKRKPSEWVRSVLYPVLNHRYNAGLPTILTFNYMPDDKDPAAPGRIALEAYLGRAVIDRVIGGSFDVIEFSGPSYRSGVKWEGPPEMAEARRR